ncbi:MAG: AraC family transcriptional regulator [Firmicutes bacterium]|nr:AraC family transcriptional regulator [Bacillota bacterium]
MNECYDPIIELKHNTKEEILLGFTYDFPYSVSKINLTGARASTWHWHKAIELVYVESGTLEYSTPSETVILNPGSAVMVSNGVLHTVKPTKDSGKASLLSHLFDTTLITGYTGSIIDQKYMSPITNVAEMEMIPLFPEKEEHKAILEKIKASFTLSEKKIGYEIRLRSILSDIWLDILMLPSVTMKDETKVLNEKIKLMIVYIQERFSDKLNIADIANAAFISERECYRTFQSVMHMTPTEYIRKYRLQIACKMLADTDETITNISQSCGFGSSSFFGKVFKETLHMTPLEYRNNMQKPKSIPS